MQVGKELCFLHIEQFTCPFKWLCVNNYPSAEYVVQYCTNKPSYSHGRFSTHCVYSTQYIQYIEPDHPPPTSAQLSTCKAIQNLKKEESIVIAPTVMLDRKDYGRKIRTLLADTDTYKRLPKDPTPAQERKMNAILLLLMRAGGIPERLTTI